MHQKHCHQQEPSYFLKMLMRGAVIVVASICITVTAVLFAYVIETVELIATQTTSLDQIEKNVARMSARMNNYEKALIQESMRRPRYD